MEEAMIKGAETMVPAEDRQEATEVLEFLQSLTRSEKEGFMALLYGMKLMKNLTGNMAGAVNMT